MNNELINRATEVSAQLGVLVIRAHFGLKLGNDVDLLTIIQDAESIIDELVNEVKYQEPVEDLE